jgi:hypothetical protein
LEVLVLKSREAIGPENKRGPALAISKRKRLPEIAAVMNQVLPKLNLAANQSRVIESVKLAMAG